MKKYILKNYDSYFTGVFEIGGTIIMVNFSSEKEDAKIYNTLEAAEEMQNRIKDHGVTIEEVL